MTTDTRNFSYWSFSWTGTDPHDKSQISLGATHPGDTVTLGYPAAGVTLMQLLFTHNAPPPNVIGQIPHTDTFYGTDYSTDDNLTVSDLSSTDLTSLYIDFGSGNDTLAAAADPIATEAHGGTGDDVLATGAGNDLLYGEDGNDTLSGGGGNNTLDGGIGTDLATYAAAPGAVVVNLNAGSASANGYGGVDTLTAIENVTGSAFNDVIIGDGNANRLTGGLGYDILVGLAGNDVLVGGDGLANEMQGGTGNDTYIVTAAGDSVIEFSGEGTDEVQTNLASYTLPANVENLTYTGSGNFIGTGNGDNNIITGGAGDDTLNGGDGNDQLFGNGGNNTLNGGNGVDTVDYSHATAGVNVNLVTGVVSSNGFGGHDTLSGVETVVGTNYADVLVGDTNSNYLIGGNGNDSLTGGTGAANTMQGGTGDDTYVAQAVGDSIIEFANEGYDTVQTALSAFTLSVNVEKLVYTGSANFTGVGEQYDDVLIGGPGSDYLIGQAGNDILIGQAGAPNTLQGGTGDDIYAIEAVGDTIIEFPGEGHDQVQTNLGSFTLPANVEDMIYTGAGNFAGTGNASDNSITSKGGNDTLSGLGGNDILMSDGGNDTLNGGTGNDILDGGGGDDTFIFAKGDGLDTIYNFKDSGAHDVIDLTGYGVASFAALQPFMSQVGADTLIAFDAQNHITLASVQLSSLTANDFVFH